MWNCVQVFLQSSSVLFPPANATQRDTPSTIRGSTLSMTATCSSTMTAIWFVCGSKSYGSQLSPGSSKIDNLLFKHVSERCLTVWDRIFPTIGCLDAIKTEKRGIRLTKGMDRYATTASACGRCYGDLKTSVSEI